MQDSHIYVFRRKIQRWTQGTTYPISRDGALQTARKITEIGMAVYAVVETPGLDPVCYPGGVAIPSTYRQ